MPCNGLSNTSHLKACCGLGNASATFDMKPKCQIWSHEMRTNWVLCKHWCSVCSRTAYSANSPSPSKIYVGSRKRGYIFSPTHYVWIFLIKVREIIIWYVWNWSKLTIVWCWKWPQNWQWRLSNLSKFIIYVDVKQMTKCKGKVNQIWLPVKISWNLQGKGI